MGHENGPQDCRLTGNVPEPIDQSELQVDADQVFVVQHELEEFWNRHGSTGCRFDRLILRSWVIVADGLSSRHDKEMDAGCSNRVSVLLYGVQVNAYRCASIYVSMYHGCQSTPAKDSRPDRAGDIEEQSDPE